MSEGGTKQGSEEGSRERGSEGDSRLEQAVSRYNTVCDLLMPQLSGPSRGVEGQSRQNLQLPGESATAWWRLRRTSGSPPVCALARRLAVIKCWKWAGGGRESGGGPFFAIGQPRLSVNSVHRGKTLLT